jgi:propanediol utilization protein
VSLTFIAAIVAFLIIERAMEKMGVSDSHWHGEEDPSEVLPENHNISEKRELEQ